MKPSMELVLSGLEELAHMSREATIDQLLALQRLANAHAAFRWAVRDLTLSTQGWAEKLREIQEREAEARVHEWKGDWLWA